VAFFTIPHFNGYPAVLIELRKASRKALRDALVDGWLACAPPASPTSTSSAAADPRRTAPAHRHAATTNPRRASGSILELPSI
jgi:hypothetical protein